MSSSCYLVAKDVYIYAFLHTILTLHPLCILCIYLYLHAYRIAGGDNTSRVRGHGRGGPAEDPATGSSRRQRTSLGRIARVPRPPTLSFSEWQGPKHSEPSMFYKYQFEFFMLDALHCRSCLKTLDAYALLV